MDPQQAVRAEAKQGVLLVTLNRPEARNSVNREVAQGLEAALDRLESEDGLWVGVLAASGAVFCAGADLEAIASGDADASTTERGGFAGLVQRRRAKPLVAAVEGPALAGGFEIVLACDLVVASRLAVFGLPEVKRSLVASGGGLFRLPRAVGEKAALEIAMTGDPVSAERAYRLGLVNLLVEPGEALDAALALAGRIASNAPLAVQESRRVILRSLGDEEELWVETGFAASRVARSEDFSEGLRAFVEKRQALWRGR